MVRVGSGEGESNSNSLCGWSGYRTCMERERGARGEIAEEKMRLVSFDGFGGLVGLDELVGLGEVLGPRFGTVCRGQGQRWRR